MFVLFMKFDPTKKYSNAELRQMLADARQEVHTLTPIVQQRNYGIPGKEFVSDRKFIHDSYVKALRTQDSILKALGNSMLGARLRKRKSQLKPKRKPYYQ